MTGKSTDLVAQVTAELADLVPGFCQNRQRDITALKEAVVKRDFKKLMQAGERLYGVGDPYGFRQITVFGRQIMEACEAKDLKATAEIIQQYEDYLRRVTVTIAPNAEIGLGPVSPKEGLPQ